MNPDTTNPPQPMNPQAPIPAPTPAPEKGGGMGGVIALVVIVLALLAGGYFLMGKMQGKKAPETLPAVTTQTAPTNTAPEAAAVDPNSVQGTGTSVADIEKDLNATDLDSLSADLNAI